jgi:hypothetical protein
MNIRDNILLTVKLTCAGGALFLILWIVDSALSG